MRDPLLAFEYRLGVALHKFPSELRDSLTNYQYAYWMAMFNMYPMGEEAMDLRFGSLIATMQSGIPTIQVKKGKRVKVQSIFARDFWIVPKALGKKIVDIFKGFGMETEGDDK